LSKKSEESFPIHIYGPVPSRRLGFSLGIDIIPFKTCTLDCIYCQLGTTAEKTLQRKEYYSQSEILIQIKEKLASGQRIDTITFSGSGEPTLNKALGKLIREIKIITPIPVAILTNSTLFTDKTVRNALMAADLVVPSLDASHRGIDTVPQGIQGIDMVGDHAGERRERFSSSYPKTQESSLQD